MRYYLYVACLSLALLCVCAEEKSPQPRITINVTAINAELLNTHACSNQTAEILKALEDEYARLFEDVAEIEQKGMFTEFGCMIACLLHQRGFMEGQRIMVDKMLTTLHENGKSKEKAAIELAESRIQHCSNKYNKEATPCTIAWTFSMCIGDIVGF